MMSSVGLATTMARLIFNLPAGISGTFCISSRISSVARAIPISRRGHTSPSRILCRATTPASAALSALSQAPPTDPCIVNAHGFRNNLPTRAPHRRGAYGVPETLGTAAIARDQFFPLGSSGWSSARKNAYINQYRNQISAYGPDGTQIFNGVCDNMGPPADVARLEADYPGSVLFELPGGSDLGKINRMRLELPLGMPCPHP